MNKASVTNNQRAFYMISFEDDDWLWTQTEAVRMLWAECSRADRFGDGAELKTNMKRATFFKAKKIIEEYGAFKFEQFPGIADARKTRWFVTNLHGSNCKSYWIQSTAVDSKSLQVDSKSLQVDSKSLQVDSKSSETLSLIQPCSSPDLKQTLNKKQTDLFQPSSKTRSGRCDGSAPFRVAAASASDAELSVKEEEATQTPETVVEASPATQLTKDPGEEEIPILFSKETPERNIEVISEQLVEKEVSSAAPHVKIKQNNLSSNKNGPKTNEKSSAASTHAKTLFELTERLDLERGHQIYTFARSLQKENKDFRFLLSLEKLIKQTEEDVLEDAIAHILERLDKIENVGGYFRQAIAKGLKPSVESEPVIQGPKEWTVETWTPDLLDELTQQYWHQVKLEGVFREECIICLVRNWHSPASHRNHVSYWFGQQVAYLRAQSQAT